MTNFRELARQAAIANGLDPDVFVTQIDTESSFNPRAVSPAGARGLGQFIPETGARYGLKTEADFFDPEKSLNASARHMKDLMEANGGNISLALAAYNAGQGAVNKHGGVPPYDETRNYVNKILGSQNPIRVLPPQGSLSPQAPQAPQPQPQQQAGSNMNPYMQMMQKSLLEGITGMNEQQQGGGGIMDGILGNKMFRMGANIAANPGGIGSNTMQGIARGYNDTLTQDMVQQKIDSAKGNNFLKNYLQIQAAMAGPDPTSAMRNYQYLVQQGVPEDEARNRAFKQGTTVNVGNGADSPYGKVQPGYQRTFDQSGSPIDQPIQGTPEYQKRANQQRSVTTAYNAIDQLMNSLKTHGEGIDLIGNQGVQGQNRLNASQVLNQIAQLGNAGVLQQGEMEYYSTLIPDLNAKGTLASRKDLESQLVTLREIIQQRTGIGGSGGSQTQDLGGGWKMTIGE